MDVFRSNRSQLGACVLLCACGPTGVAGESPNDEETTVGVVTQEISEMPNGVAEVIFRRYYSHPAVARASYAMPGVSGCSATMIGPNILMTAAHCGTAGTSATFNTWRRAATGGYSSVPDSETFNCRYLIQTFGCAPGVSVADCPADSDLLLRFCDANADGVNPGDKYGYLDFDPIWLPVGHPLYSIWTNGNPTLPDGTLIYSQGTVRSNTVSKANLWSVPAELPNSGLDLNMMSQSGCSGSPALDLVTNKIVAGPTSTAFGSPTRYRGTNSIWSYLYGGYVNTPPGGVPTVNAAEVTNHGLVPSDYLGWADKQLDWLFDIQQDIERNRGESARGWYHLGFESPRRNWLWTGSPGATIDANTGNLHMVHTSTVAEEFSHQRLKLDPQRTYRFQVLTKTTQSAGASLGLRSNNGLTSVPLSMVPGGDWEITTGTLRTVGGSDTLVLRVNGGTSDFLMRDLVLIRDGQMLNFDTHDERLSWFDSPGGPGAVVPEGYLTGAPNFAGVVRVAANAPNDVSLRNTQLALTPNQPYTVCFAAKPINGVITGRITVTAGSASTTRTFQALAGGWDRFCSPVLVAAAGLSVVEFRVESAGTNERGYYVEDVSVLGQSFNTVSFDAGEDRRFSDFDWSVGNYKSECADGDYMSGVSATSIGMGPELRGHNAVCTEHGYALDSQRTVHDLTYADDRGDTSTGDWAVGYIKGECARDEVVTGIAQVPGGSISPTAIRCSKLAQVEAVWCGEALVFRNDSDVRRSTNSGDWAPGYSKNECGPDQILKGVSRDPATGEIHSLLCCSAGSTRRP